MNFLPSQLYPISEQEYKQFPRYAKGYFYEIDVQHKLDNSGIRYNGNSREYTQWLKQTNTGYDIKVNIGNRTINIECKFTLTPIYHSWFIRDWLSRDSDIFVTNNKWNISYNDRRLLDKEHKKLFSIDELIIYLKHLMNSGNKYIVFESLNSAYTGITGPKQTLNKTETDRTQSLNKYLTDKTDSKIANNQILSGRDLNCYNCLKRDRCPILQKLDELEVKRPSIRLVQSNITDNLKNRKIIDKQDFKKRNREWLIRYSRVWIEQQKCLNRRVYLHNYNSKYKLFRIKPIT